MPKANLAFILFLILLAAFRLSLIFKGHFFDADEHRYLYAIWCWNDLLHGKFFQGISCIFEVQARPGFVFISLIPAGIQIFLAQLHLIPTDNLHFFDLPSFFNVAMSLVNTVLFYHILILVVSDQFLGLIGTVVYSLLVNSNVYIRHLFPYDYSLFFFFLVVFIILKNASLGILKVNVLFLAGVLSAAGALVYPGYYSLVLIILIYLSLTNRCDLKILGEYLGGFFLVLAGVEFASQLLSKSYFMECMVLSDTVKHGSFNEGFLFMPRYLAQVEGVVGLFLLVLLIIYCFLFWPKDRASSRWLIFSAILIYSLHALLGIVFHKMVFYGRSLHMYFPFLVLAAIVSINHIANLNYKRAVAAILLVVSLASFTAWAPAYEQLSYPGDFYFKYLDRIPQSSAVAINLKSYFDPNQQEVNPRIGHMTLMADKAHPLNFPSYAFENYAPLEREKLREGHYRMKIYADTNAPTAVRLEKSSFDSLMSLTYKVAKFN